MTGNTKKRKEMVGNDRKGQEMEGFEEKRTRLPKRKVRKQEGIKGTDRKWIEMIPKKAMELKGKSREMNGHENKRNEINGNARKLET